MSHLIRTATVWAFAVGLAATVAAQTPPDNTKVNARDRQANAKTADQQSNAKADLETSRQIRRAIVADKNLSTNAHNVKIITRAGKVTLKGPVQTDAEKQSVESKAADVAGSANVTSQIRVQATSATPSNKSPKKGR